MHEPKNTMTQTGATDLAIEIKNYWVGEGYIPDVWTEALSIEKQGQVWVVRSNMVNGQPRRKSNVGKL